MSDDPDEVYEQRWLKRMKDDFVPSYNSTTMPNPDARMATSAEYSAFQLGRISRSLEEISDTLKAIYAKM